MVVLLSEDAFEDGRWLPPIETTKDAHLIPVRLGELDHERVPKYLRELNWIDWNPVRPATALGFIVAGLLSDPSRYRISRQLAHEAAVWQGSGRRRDHLIGDRRRARQMESSSMISPKTRSPRWIRLRLSSLPHRTGRREKRAGVDG